MCRAMCQTRVRPVCTYEQRDRQTRDMNTDTNSLSDALVSCIAKRCISHIAGSLAFLIIGTRVAAERRAACPQG